MIRVVSIYLNFHCPQSNFWKTLSRIDVNNSSKMVKGCLSNKSNVGHISAESKAFSKSIALLNKRSNHLQMVVGAESRSKISLFNSLIEVELSGVHLCDDFMNSMYNVDRRLMGRYSLVFRLYVSLFAQQCNCRIFPCFWYIFLLIK